MQPSYDIKLDFYTGTDIFTVLEFLEQLLLLPRHHLVMKLGKHQTRGSMYVFGKLPFYPSPNQSLTLTSRFGQNVRFGEG